MDLEPSCPIPTLLNKNDQVAIYISTEHIKHIDAILVIIYIANSK